MSAVPIEATTGSRPAWRSAITSVLPLDDDRPLLLRDRLPREVRARRAPTTCGRGRPPASSRTSPGADRPRGASARCSRRTRPRASASGNISLPGEVVVPAAVGEPGGSQLGSREALLGSLPRERRATAGDSPSRNSRQISSPSPRPARYRAHRLALRGLPQVPLVERRRLLEHGVQPLASLPRGVGGRATSPRTRAARGSARRATRSHRRSRGSPSPGRTRSGRRPCRSRSSRRACRRD